MQIRSRYALGDPVKGLEFTQSSLTQQQFKDECEIESLLKAHNLGQVMGILNNHERQPLYGDVSDIPDFHDAQNHVARATEYFEGLPSDVRSRFNNSLSEFLTTLNNPDAREALSEMGVLKKVEDKAADKVDVQPVVPPVADKQPIVSEPASQAVENNPKT
jgi:phage internal scaffolding protein